MSDLPFGPGRSSAYQELVLSAGSGTLYLPLYQNANDARRQKPNDPSGRWSSGQGDQKDVPRRVHTLDRGAGFSRKPSGYGDVVEWTGFAESENACTRFGYVIPSGEQTSTTVTTTWGACNKIISFNGDLFFIFDNMIAYKSGGTGSLTFLYFNSGDLFKDAVIWDGALRVAILCSHANPNQHFFVTLTPGAPYTTINPTPATPAGTAATASTPQIRLVETVFWEYQAVADYRLTGQDGTSTFRYMITPSGDPYDVLNWGPSTQVGDTSIAISAMEASHDTVWFLKSDGVYTVTDANASAGGENITPYWRQEEPNLAVGVTSQIVPYYWQDKLIVSRGGYSGVIEAIDVNSFQVQDRPAPIQISYGRPNDTALNGRYTAHISEGGWLVSALTNIDSESYVLYGTPRRRESSVAGVTEYDWFPEIGPFEGYQITAMGVFTPVGGRPTLWLALEAIIAPFAPDIKIVAVDLISGASPLADTGHRYNTSCSITFTDEQWQSRIAAKGALQGAVACRNISSGAGRKLDVYVAAESGTAFPGSPSMSVTATGAAGGTAALHSVISRAQVVRSKIVLTSTATVPVVLDEWEMKANLGYPLRRHGSWLVELSDASKGDLPDATRNPVGDETLLVVLCQGLEVVEAKVLPDGENSFVVLGNLLPYRDESRTSSGRRSRVFEISYVQVS